MRTYDLENLTHTGYIKTREAVESRSNLLDKFTQIDGRNMDEGEALHKRENVTEGNKKIGSCGQPLLSAPEEIQHILRRKQ